MAMRETDYKPRRCSSSTRERGFTLVGGAYRGRVNPVVERESFGGPDRVLIRGTTEKQKRVRVIKIERERTKEFVHLGDLRCREADHSRLQRLRLVSTRLVSSVHPRRGVRANGTRARA